MTNRPRLYPGHPHQWADDPDGTPLVRCTVCGFQAPRNAAGLDGSWQRLHIAWEDSPPPPSPREDPLIRQAEAEARALAELERQVKALTDPQPERETRANA